MVYNAGTAAQRRRSLSGSRRCSSASSVPFRRSSRRSSLGLDRFLDVLNDNIDEGKKRLLRAQAYYSST